MDAINDAQRRKIFWLCKELGIDEDTRHAVLLALTDGRTEHLGELTKADAIHVIDYLSQRSGVKAPPRPTNRASKEQLWKINQLEKELGWTDDPDRLQGFIKKYAGVDRTEWLTPLQASNVIEGLKRVLAKERRAKKGEAAGGDAKQSTGP